jgi:hypothetical protein
VPPTYYVYPEFGYFCPSPGARRELRVAVVSILFGMVIGAAIVTVRAGHVVENDGVSSGLPPMLTIDRKVHPLKRFKAREVPLWSA